MLALEKKSRRVLSLVGRNLRFAVERIFQNEMLISWKSARKFPDFWPNLRSWILRFGKSPESWILIQISRNRKGGST